MPMEGCQGCDPGEGMPLSRRTASDAKKRKVPLSRRFTYRYMVALGLLGAMALIAFVSVSGSLARIEAKSRQLEDASTQAARIYRIVAFAEEINLEARSFGAPLRADGTPDTSRLEFVGDRNRIDERASQLRQELNMLRQTQKGLLNGDTALGLLPPDDPRVGPISTRLRDVYFEPDQLDQKITYFASAADQVVSLKNPDQDNDSLRQGQVQTLKQQQSDLVRSIEKTVSIYQDEVEDIIDAQRDTNSLMLVAGMILAGATALALFRPMAQKIRSETTQLEEAEKIHRENNERQSFRTALAQALEVTDSEDEVLAAVGRAVLEVVPEFKAELLMLDSTHAHLRKAQANPALGGPDCPVDSPSGCAAIRRMQTQVYESSRMLNVCPKLPEHSGGPCSAVCVPVMFSGQAIGVLHTVGKDNKPPTHTQIERLTVLASETGNRTGTLRVTQMTERQAATDGLTGLLNRRSLESKARGLILNDDSFSVAIADLDHFKDLNDTYGHEAGDRALRLFAKVMKDNLRPDDIPGRYGGEEFVVLLPETNIHEALAALERLQAALLVEIERTSSMPFTASWGLTDHSAGTTFDEMISVADAALYSAKRAGRNCIMVDGEAAAALDDIPGEGHWGDGEAGSPQDNSGDGHAAIDVGAGLLDQHAEQTGLATEQP